MVALAGWRGDRGAGVLLLARVAVVAKVSLSPSPQRQGHTNCSTSGLPQTFPQRALPSIERALLASRRTEPVSRLRARRRFLIF